MNINGSKTKEVIFDTAVKIIFDIGYDKMNMRQIAKMSGIKAASIYNHYKGKQEILDAIYAYYEEHLYDNMKPDEEIKKIIALGTKDDIVNALAFTFEGSDEKKYFRMIWISKIIYFRLSMDKRACDIFLNSMTKSAEDRVIKFLDYGVLIGRFKPFDTKTYAALFTGTRQIFGIKAFAKSDYSAGQLEEEKLLNTMLADFLPLK